MAPILATTLAATAKYLASKGMDLLSCLFKGGGDKVTESVAKKIEDATGIQVDEIAEGKLTNEQLEKLKQYELEHQKVLLEHLADKLKELATLKDERRAKYREMLIETKDQINAGYDKLIVTLAGGALALSITFLKDVISIEKIHAPGVLLAAWVFFVISLTAILGENLFGIEAYKLAIDQLDGNTRKLSRAGGVFSKISKYLRHFAGVSLVSGLLLISTFAYFNIGR